MRIYKKLKGWLLSLLGTLGVLHRPCSVQGLPRPKQKRFVRKHKGARDRNISEYVKRVQQLEKQLADERLDNILTMNSVMVGYEDQIAEQRSLLISVNRMLKDTMKYQTPALIREKYSYNYFSKSIEEIVKGISTYMSSKGKGSSL